MWSDTPAAVGSSDMAAACASVLSPERAFDLSGTRNSTPSLQKKGSTLDAHMTGRPNPFGHRRSTAEGMEHLWSPAGATGGNRWQMEHPRKPLKQADPQPVATHGNRSGAHGKEGVDGSSPSEGFTKRQQMALFVASTAYVRLLSVPQPVPKICPQHRRSPAVLA